jgi:hypothetical protein
LRLGGLFENRHILKIRVEIIRNIEDYAKQRYYAKKLKARRRAGERRAL